MNKEAKPVYVVVKWGERRGLVVDEAETPKEALEMAKDWLDGGSGYLLTCERLETQERRSGARSSLPPAGQCFAKAASLAAEPWKARK